jgi:two-component system CheB/CheR fusion protein
VGEPVVVEDLSEETRFSGPALLLEHGAVSGMSVPMVSEDFVFGVMGVHSTRPRSFSSEDVQFLQSLANVVTHAVVRRRAEDEARSARDYAEAIVETVREPLVVLDEDLRVVSANRSFYEIFQVEPGETEGRFIYELGNRQWDIPELRELLEKIIPEDTEFHDFEVDHDFPTIGRRIMLLNARRVTSREARTNFTLLAIEDITERKRAELELRQAHEELKEAYRNLERAQATAIASEKMAALGRLTAGVSHEILNPLNVIMMRLHMMLSDPEIKGKLREDIQDMQEQADCIVKIAQDLLYFARQRHPERAPVDLNATVRRTLGLLEHDLRLMNISVELKLVEDLPSIHADEDQLQQVILNLLTNARDVMPQGGRLRLQTSLVQENGAEEVELRVEDTGPGIPPEHVTKIFDPFFTTKPEGQGTGLGLSICQGIIEAHGGRIWAENAPGGGASFVIRLRVEEDHGQEDSRGGR